MALRKDAKAKAIAKVPLFARCSKRELANVASIADEIDFPAGKELTREGSPGREFFLLLEGTADVRRDGRKIAALGPGDFFGEIALISGVPRTATVITSSPVRALVVTDRAFRSLLKSNSQVQLKVLQALAERVGHETP